MATSLVTFVCLTVIIAFLTARAAIWCGYLQCTKHCNESEIHGTCHVCMCSCGNSTCMEDYYCLYGITSANDPMSNPKCCSNTRSNDPTTICLLPGEKNISSALPNF